MTKTVKTLLAIAVIGAILVVFYTKVYTQKVTFEQTSPTLGQLNVKVFGVGHLDAKSRYNVSSSSGGKIVKTFADEGQWVKQGDLLATIDPIDLPILLDEAKVSIKKANAELDIIQKSLISAVAQKELAVLTFKRNQRLKQQALISQFEYDKAETDLRVINAQIEETKARIISANIEIIRTNKAAKALEVKLSRYNIYAPINGYVIAKNAEVAQTITPSQSIFTMVDPKTVWINAYIDERISGDIKVGQNATISLRSQPNKTFKGTVARIVAKTDAITQEKEINIAFNKLPIPFYINEQATVNIASHEFNQVIKVPNQYIAYRENKVGVWVNQNDKAHFQLVNIIARGENETAVSGLTKKTLMILPDEQKKTLTENMSIH